LTSTVSGDPARRRFSPPAARRRPRAPAEPRWWKHDPRRRASSTSAGLKRRNGGGSLAPFAESTPFRRFGQRRWAPSGQPSRPRVSTVPLSAAIAGNSCTAQNQGVPVQLGGLRPYGRASGRTGLRLVAYGLFMAFLRASGSDRSSAHRPFPQWNTAA
jgi:hypothetical protein